MHQLIKKWGICLVAVWLSAPASAQIQVNFPTSRAVFQRGNNGRGTFSIAGNYYQPVDQIQARVVPIQGGSATDWITIQANPQQGNFLGSLDVVGGWYRLEVRGMLGGGQVGQPAVVDRMGVGEVLLISGQSNGQGFSQSGGENQPGQRDPVDDRVSVINYFNNSNSTSDLPYPSFSKLTANSSISPRGLSAWSWGPLGDLLTARFNVPVLFLNAAWFGTDIESWRASAAGQRGENIFCRTCGEDAYYPNGMPYGNLKLALNYYGSLLGIRAVLWIQGETDNSPLRTGTDDYREKLKFVINQSRNDAGKNITWVVAQTSLVEGISSQSVLDAQAQVVQQLPNVFPGPFTDNIQPSRYDGRHFSPNPVPGTGKSGHQLHAEAWNIALTDAFFAASQPQTPAGLLPVSIACAGNTGYTLTVAGNQPSWSNGASGSSISVGRGLYYGKVRDGSGNILLSQPVFVPQPAINAKSATEFCQGGSVTLEADAPGGISWSTGTNNQSITANTSGTYSVSFRDQNGCTLTNSVAVKVNPLPDKPRIAALSDTVFCQGGTVVLRSVENTSYAWSNGANTRDLTVATSGRFQVSVIDAKGCRSPTSDQISVRVNPNPTKPIISAGGRTTFCADESVVLTSTLSDSANYVWSPNPVGVRTRSIRINQAGSYTVRTFNRFGCISVPSDPITTRVNALPAQPLVSASGRQIFCEGESVTLCTNNPLITAWVESSDSTVVLANTACFVASTTGRFRVRVIDANGCKNFSVPSVVVAKPLPGKPVIQRIGTYTLSAEGTPPGQAYRWLLNSKDTLSSRYYTKIIKTPSEGVYTAIARITYSDVTPALTCFSPPSDRTDASVVIFPDNGGLSVYPNPSLDGNLTIETQEDWEGADVTIWTLSGQLLFQDRVNVFDERKVVRMGPQPGLFLLRVKTDRFNKTKRILVRP